MRIPRPDAGHIQFFKSLVPDNPRVKVRPMFGNIAAFVNRNLYMGMYGNDIFLRLSQEHQLELMQNKGAKPFEPVKGRRMKGYVVIPMQWQADRLKLLQWMSRSLEWTGKLPAK